MTYREFTIVIERDTEGYYVASVPELRGCHTQARSLDTLMERIKEAIELSRSTRAITFSPHGSA
jgi:predicted RNase H-like HicB family nuclease